MNEAAELINLMSNKRPVRVWFDDMWPRNAGDVIWDELYTDNDVWLPMYLDTMELGQRVSDYINSPAEEHMLEDMVWGSMIFQINQPGVTA